MVPTDLKTPINKSLNNSAEQELRARVSKNKKRKSSANRRNFDIYDKEDDD